MSHDVERRPGGDQGGEDEPGGFSAEGTAIPPDLGPTADELRAEVYRLVEPVVTAGRRHGRLVGVGSDEWWTADDAAKLAGVQILALAWLIHDPDRAAAERLKRMAVDLSEAHDWSAASRRPSHAELQRRRGAA